MKTGNETPEPLAAVLAEMRAEAKSTDLFNGEEVGEPLIRGTKVEDWADRIEAAAERERDEDRQLAAIAESDEAFARCARCDRPERAPGNAAAIREEALTTMNVILATIALSGQGFMSKENALQMIENTVRDSLKKLDSDEQEGDAE